MRNQRPYFIQFACIMTALTAIMIQGFTHVVKMKPLYGFVKKAEVEALSFKTFYSGSYQSNLTERAKEHTGFREFFIRNYNQVLYSCFHKITNENIAEGYDRELFLKDMYLNEVTGDKVQKKFGSVDEAKAVAERAVRETLILMDTLQRHGKYFLFVFAPTKTAVYPEKMPQYYQDHLSDFSLEEYYIQLFKENNIPHLDLYSYFKSISDTVTYPLYTRLASHWAESTIPWVADTIFRQLEAVTGYHLPSIHIIDNNITTDYSDYDHELELSMNLLFPWPKPALPRPVYELQDTIGKDRPNLVIVGDSYFDQLMFSCFKDAFHQWDFWKRMAIVYSPQYWQVRFEDVPNTSRMLQQADIVLAISTAPSLYNYLFGFTDKAYDLLENQKKP